MTETSKTWPWQRVAICALKGTGWVCAKGFPDYKTADQVYYALAGHAGPCRVKSGDWVECANGAGYWVQREVMDALRAPSAAPPVSKLVPYFAPAPEAVQDALIAGRCKLPVAVTAAGKVGIATDPFGP